MRNNTINQLGIKYNFSIYSKNDIKNMMNIMKNNYSLYPINEYYTIKNYYFQTLPIILCKLYLNIDPNDKKKYNEYKLIIDGCTKHQKELIDTYKEHCKINHLIDGLVYECSIKYGGSSCDCGVTGYTWTSIENILYRKSYWIMDEYIPLIRIKREPVLSMIDEINIIQSYIKRTNFYYFNKNDLKWINSKNITYRIQVYPSYYLKYWQWEHIEGEKIPITINDWCGYFKTSGCANHRDLIETIHIYNRNENTYNDKSINYRYTYTFA